MQYLQDGDRVYTTGAWLIYDQEKNTFVFDGIEDDTYFDGEFVNYDEHGQPYIERDGI
jgi:hypothetical protein